jgi:hypothetical protein
MAKKQYKKKAGAIGQSVTVVSSIPIDNHTRHQFENALNAHGIHINPTYNDNNGAGLGYGSQLDAAVHSPVSGLLVTLGGLVAFNSALSHSRTKFISLIGGLPQLNGNPFPTPVNGINFWGP